MQKSKDSLKDCFESVNIYFDLTLQVCEDIDECALSPPSGPCVENSQCTNTIVSIILLLFGQAFEPLSIHLHQMSLSMMKQSKETVQ